MVYELRYGDHLLKFLSVYALLEYLEESCRVSRDVLGELSYCVYRAVGDCLFVSRMEDFEVAVRNVAMDDNEVKADV